MTTTHSNPDSNSAPTRRTPGRVRAGPSVPDVAGELRRLMPRDRWLIDLLGEHQVFTTEHGEHATHPAGPVWLLPGHSIRLRLTDLPATNTRDQAA